jgi:hypothetical protein
MVLGIVRHDAQVVHGEVDSGSGSWNRVTERVDDVGRKKEKKEEEERKKD